MWHIALIELEPPGTLPRGRSTDAVVEPRLHGAFVIPVHGAVDQQPEPAGMWMKGCQSRGPASSSSL